MAKERSVGRGQRNFAPVSTMPQIVISRAYHRSLDSSGHKDHEDNRKRWKYVVNLTPERFNNNIDNTYIIVCHMDFPTHIQTLAGWEKIYSSFSPNHPISTMGQLASPGTHLFVAQELPESVRKEDGRFVPGPRCGQERDATTPK